MAASDGENEEFDWLIIALAVAAALTVAWRFLNPLGVHLTHQRRTVASAPRCAALSPSRGIVIGPRNLPVGRSAARVGGIGAGKQGVP